jgi:uncharacterized integral membrane protein
MMSTLNSKFKIFKIGISLLLITALTILLAQNIQPVNVDLIFWKINVPLVLLLLGTAVLSALIVFFTIIIKGK